MFPIKYIENNLVFNHDGECFAYYELTPYNYSFLSPEEKYINVNIKMYIFDHLRMYIFAILPLDRYIFSIDRIFP